MGEKSMYKKKVFLYVFIYAFFFTSLYVCAENFSEQTKALMDIVHQAGKALMAKEYTNIVNILEGKLPSTLTEGDGSRDFAAAYGLGYNNLGIAYLQLGKIDKAIAALNKCKHALSGWSAPYYLLGQAYFKSGMFEESALNFNKGFGLEPDAAIAKDYFFFIIDNLKINNRSEAERLFKIAKEKFPTNFKAESLADIENSLKKE